MDRRRGHKGQQLDACSNDLERAALCREWNEEARDKWYVRRDEQAAISADLGAAFGRSVLGRDLAGLEQMYHRWMMGYLEWYRIKSEAGML